MKRNLVLRISVLISINIVFACFILIKGNEKIHSISGKAQGTAFLIRYKAVDPLLTLNDLSKVFDQLDSSLSLYKTYSLINQFNAAQYGIVADSHLLNVVKKSIEISTLSGGCFDITVKPLVNLWGFHSSSPKSSPSPDQLSKTLHSVGFQKLMLKDSLIRKSVPGLAIDCDGIAQGYSVDVLAAFLEKLGIQDYQIEVGGEVRVKGSSLDNKPWVTKIQVLDDKDQLIEADMNLRNESVTTSGSFSKFSKLGGRYFSHIIDPRVGKPINNGIVAVSVVHANTMTADGLDNAFMVMGYDKAIEYANTQKDVGVYMIYKKKNGRIADTANAYFTARVIPSVAASPHWQ